MKNFIFALFFLSTAATADDAREWVKLPAPAQESLRLEMLDNLVAVNEVLSLMAAGKVKEAGEVASVQAPGGVRDYRRGGRIETRPLGHGQAPRQTV